ncbi:MAG: beta-propeller fold lactonase family protein [Bacteroidota bacterium]
MSHSLTLMAALRVLPALVLGLFLYGCDSSKPITTTPFDPSTVDYDALTSVDYDDHVRPLLAARNVFGAAGAGAASPTDYDHDDVFGSEWGKTIVPFDATSPMIRLATETLVDELTNPYPNLAQLDEDEVRFLTRWIEAGAPDSDGTPAYADSKNLLYVCNQLAGRVAIVDTDQMRTIRHVYFEDLDQPADAKPHHVVVEPDGSAWYVALISGGSGGGAVLRLSGSLETDPADSSYLLANSTNHDEFEKPGMLSLDPVGGRLYSGRSFSASATSNGIGQFTNLSSLTFDVVATPPYHPHAVEATPDGRHVLSAGLSSPNEVRMYDAATQDVVARAPVENGLAFVQFAVTSDSRAAVLTSQLSGELFVIDIDPNAPSVSVRDRIAVGQQPWHPVISPDDETVYVPNRLSNSVSFVDLASGAVTRTVENPENGSEVFSQPHGAALTADGRVLFVANRNLMMTGDALYQAPLRFVMEDGSPEPADMYSPLVAIDTQTGAILDVIQQGRWSSGLSAVRIP